ncbi:OLC1v1017653C1 [Oldenlandia corymbosa var. corymbosa]|uniref:OLC1v1017653C1 n=1 Tax=Oldenlandia corymbosa var. corymbosa TaxID=529605 RepID=A0AAV1E9Y3_OLDCO|nr:OLC1v1017653C1 [Oldenlandia corymbosa var. corymbosa]
MRKKGMQKGSPCNALPQNCPSSPLFMFTRCRMSRYKLYNPINNEFFYADAPNLGDTTVRCSNFDKAGNVGVFDGKLSNASFALSDDDTTKGGTFLAQIRTIWKSFKTLELGLIQTLIWYQNLNFNGDGQI